MYGIVYCILLQCSALNARMGVRENLSPVGGYRYIRDQACRIRLRKLVHFDFRVILSAVFVVGAIIGCLNISNSPELGI